MIIARGHVWVLHQRIRGAEGIRSIHATRYGAANKARDMIVPAVEGMHASNGTTAIWDTSVVNTLLDQDGNGAWWVRYDLAQ